MALLTAYGLKCKSHFDKDVALSISDDLVLLTRKHGTLLLFSLRLFKL